MKQLLHILFVLMIIGCSQNSNQQNNAINETNANSISTESTFDFYSDSVLTHIDAEELCEFSFDFFLPKLNQKLSKNNFKLDVQTSDDYESSFEIVINGQPVKLYSNEELANGSFLDRGARNFFKLVNKILKENNIDKKFYLLYGGNDLHAIFLTIKQFELMSKTYKDDRNEIPYLP